MLDVFINKYNQFRKEKYFKNPLFKTKKKYACVGLGMHSLTNIYPILRHFNVHVKYLCTKNSSWNKDFAALFQECHFTNDLSVIVNDEEIDGVFVSATESEHYTILYTLLKAGKKVFIEKPPCSSSAELYQLLAIDKPITCKVGLQRRYWDANKYVLKKTSTAISYIYQFCFGPYLKGNVVNELFIHALDYCIYIFGPCTILSKTIQKKNNGTSIQLHLQHDDGVIGLTELSTHCSWSNPLEHLSVICENEKLNISYPLKVSGALQPTRLFNMPSEQIFSQPIITKEYFSAGNMINPVAHLNTLVLQGFYGELNNFIQITEGLKPEENDLKTLGTLYKILDELNGFV